MTVGNSYIYNGTEVLLTDDHKYILRWSIESFLVLKVGSTLLDESSVVAIQYADGIRDFIVNPIDSDFTEV